MYHSLIACISDRIRRRDFGKVGKVGNIYFSIQLNLEDM